MQPHEVLGVAPGASPRAVTDAFRRFALRNHPDRGGDPSTFQAGVDAYHQLLGRRGGRPAAAAADVVFYRRRRGLVPTLRRLTRRRRPARSLS